MELHYILTKEDISAYYEALLENDDSTFAFRWRLRLFLPLGIAVFLIFFSQAAYWWLVGAALSALWILIADRLIYPQYAKRIVRKMTDANQENTKMSIRIVPDGIFVDQKARKMERYMVQDQFIAVGFTDHTSLILPNHAFADEKEKMEAVQMIQNLMPTGRDTDND